MDVKLGQAAAIKMPCNERVQNGSGSGKEQSQSEGSRNARARLVSTSEFGCSLRATISKWDAEEQDVDGTARVLNLTTFE